MLSTFLLGPPEFINELQDVNVTEGGALKLTTAVKPEPNQIASWKKDGLPIKLSTFVKVSTKDGISVLTIRNVKLEHSGEYSYEVKNETGSLESSCLVMVEKGPSAPVFMKKLLPTINVAEFEDAEFLVVVEGFPAPTIEWMYKGKTLKEDDKFCTETLEGNHHKLVIKKCTLSDRGRIKVLAKNKVSQVSNFCELIIKQAPPTIKLVSDLVQTALLGKDITFEIEAPSDGGSYKVTWTHGVKNIFRSNKKFEVSKNKNKYSLTVKAIEDSDKGVYKCCLQGPSGKSIEEFTLQVQGDYSIFLICSC